MSPHTITEVVTSQETDDGARQSDLEKLDKSGDTSPTPSICPSEQHRGEKTIVRFADDDPLNPYNWKRSKKLYVVIVSMVMVMNSTIGSSIASGASAETQRYFGVQSESQMVLPVSIYLIGYVIGPLVFAPLSESYGRKPVMLSTFVVFTAFTLGTALAPTFAGLVVMRLLVGIGASTPMSVIGGIYADIYNTRKARGLVITLFMAATTWGPLIGPIVSGYVSVVSWRWSYWCLLIISGATWPFFLFMPETYGPIVLKREAQRLRKKTGDQNILAPIELEAFDLRNLLVVVLTRPIRMFFTEAIVLTSCLYLSVIYGIFYMFFQAYPIIFGGIYGFSAGEEGLAFLPIGVGAVIASLIYMAWDSYYERSSTKSPQPGWTKKEEYIRLPLACFGGPLFVISLFWLGWTARPDIHWIVPTLSALPFGIGFLLIFMGELNYIVDAYEVFAASAMGAASCSRSLFGVILPFAARPMYSHLGIGWACSVLGFLSLVMALIPFVFIRFGDRIRANSKFCQQLKREKEEKEAGERSGRESRANVQPVSADLEKQA
ncbi:hypothetical protein LTR91_023708 [Friedmanniomyces endolithicus]|uniref:Major facilitator superfamily (MFS) profile domain-containing protein n=1 Tax=Friedmanniomyces endolithicus TaxID=329885 RepID=A0AAN6H2G4_9PEZI|nr:hypothetical protein LTR94_007734 [Friedmanniomyces endolithicus]KAK0772858.1 hypothetical protein LTR38_016761 [Friedmanniomyces endolithicus]KAK0801946.1 hypothetical protein LTR59_005300 [Friedmanniomyces endolithicus]KAK0817356.1 hypothetical protein LTR75_003095 [Friedmanniomyces endolithicus]KAK0879651.1 hypothetical protein LTR87_006451 [Friedmanniomyces endolithicus]